jgi:hypothetical protein
MHWFQKWFKESQKDPWLIQTPLLRTSQQIEDFEAWQKSLQAQEQLSELLRAFEFYKLGIASAFRISTIHTQGAEGLYFVPPSNWSDLDSTHIYDWICWLPMRLGYTEAHSEQKTNWVNPIAGQRDFRYLKPAHSVNTGQEIPQMFGNLMVERMVVEGKTQWIKILSQYYQGRPYQQVNSFSGFLDLIFDLESGRNAK